MSQLTFFTTDVWICSIPTTFNWEISILCTGKLRSDQLAKLTSSPTVLCSEGNGGQILIFSLFVQLANLKPADGLVAAAYCGGRRADDLSPRTLRRRRASARAHPPTSPQPILDLLWWGPRRRLD